MKNLLLITIIVIAFVSNSFAQTTSKAEFNSAFETQLEAAFPVNAPANWSTNVLLIRTYNGSLKKITFTSKQEAWAFYSKQAKKFAGFQKKLMWKLAKKIGGSVDVKIYTTNMEVSNSSNTVFEGLTISPQVTWRAGLAPVEVTFAENTGKFKELPTEDKKRILRKN
jgi:hypothetical protein